MPDFLVYAGAAAILYLGIVAIVYVEKYTGALAKIDVLEYELLVAKGGGLTVTFDEDFDLETGQLVEDKPVDYTLTDKGWDYAQPTNHRHPDYGGTP